MDWYPILTTAVFALFGAYGFAILIASELE